MNIPKNSNTVEWTFHFDQLPQAFIEQWHQLSREAELMCASSHYKFASTSLDLIKATKKIYALAHLNNQLVTALALVETSKKFTGMPYQSIQLINHDHLDFYMAPNQNSLDPDQLLNSLKQAMQKQLKGWHLFIARRWFFPSPPRNNYLSPIYSRSAAYFNLSEKSAIEELISKKMLKNIRRYEKKLHHSNGPITLFVAVEYEEIKDGIADFLRLEASGWKGEAGSAISCSSELKHFYAENWQHFSKENRARLYLLRQANKVIAASIGYQHGETIYLHKIAYDETLATFSPGSILVKQIIESALIQSHCSEICFNTNPPWLQRWHPEYHPLFAVMSFNHNFRGQLLDGLFYVSNQLRLIKRKFDANRRQKQKTKSSN